MTGRNEIIGWGWAPKSYGANIFTHYKLSTNDVADLFDKQQGKCAGCDRELAHPFKKELRTGLKPQVDHMHRWATAGTPLSCERADVRGLLCGECNFWVGQLRDNAERIERLGVYLRKGGVL